MFLFVHQSRNLIRVRDFDESIALRSTRFARNILVERAYAISHQADKSQTINGLKLRTKRIYCHENGNIRLRETCGAMRCGSVEGG